MTYCGVPATQWASSGVAIAIRKDWKHKIQEYNWISDRIIETRKVMRRFVKYIILYKNDLCLLYFSYYICQSAADTINIKDTEDIVILKNRFKFYPRLWQ
jgi:hypothetical protein